MFAAPTQEVAQLMFGSSFFKTILEQNLFEFLVVCIIFFLIPILVFLTSTKVCYDNFF